MKLLKLLTVGSLLFASSAFADGFGLGVGPFNLQLDVGGSYYENENEYREVLHNPFCDAISNQYRLEMIVEGAEKVSAKEIKVVTKKIVVEPYAFGVSRDGQPILRGNVTDEKLIKEVTVKYGEDQFENKNTPEQKKKGYFSGLFKSDKNQNIDIRKVSNIRVIDDARFDAPKIIRVFKKKGIKVICQLPVSEK